MKLPSLFRSQKSLQRASGSAQDQAEKMLGEAFRLLGQVCVRMAEVVEAQRLGRAGYERQGKFLERLDVPAEPRSTGAETFNRQRK